MTSETATDNSGHTGLSADDMSNLTEATRPTEQDTDLGPHGLPEPQAQPQSEESAPEATQQGTPAEPATPEVGTQEIESIRRALVADPVARQQYVQQQQQQPVQPQAQSAPQSEQAPATPALPFDADTFDPTSFDHMSALIAHHTRQSVSPALDYINQVQQHELQQAEQRALEAQARQAHELQNKVHQMIDAHLPEFSKLQSKDNPSEAEWELIDFAAGKWARSLKEHYPPDQYGHAWGDPRVLQSVANFVGPSIKRKAESLGLFKSEQPKPADSGSNVESSNAIVTGGGNQDALAQALKANDLEGMMAALL